MPAGILNGEQAKEVAEFVANTAGEGWNAPRVESPAARMPAECAWR